MPAGRPGSCGRGGSRTRPVFFAEIDPVPHRDRSGGVAPGCRGHETGISARDRHFRASQRGRRRTHAEMSSSMCRGGAPVGLFLRGRRTGLLGQRPPGLTALFLRGRRTGPAPGPGAVVGLEQECSRRRGYQRQILEEAEDTLGMPASAGPPVRAGRPRGSPSLSRVAFDASGAGGTTPPPTGSSPGARAASLCSTAPGPRNTFSLIVNIPERRRPARRQCSRDEGPRVGTDLEPKPNRSRRRGGGAWRPSSAPGPGRRRYRPTSRRTRPSTSARRALTP